METSSSAPATSSVRPRRRWLRRILVAVVVMVIGVTCVELYVRFRLGLGDPPLSMDDPGMKYLFQPNQDGWRFGNHYHYNAYSMRSEDFPAHKTDPHELRVMLVGNSIINGGNLTDQKDIVSAILEDDLKRDLGRPVIVGNISAGGWHAPSEYGYVKKFGLFDADVVVIVLASFDCAEDPPPYPHFSGVLSYMPDHKPVLAIQEAVTRYLPRYLPGWLHGAEANESGPIPDMQATFTQQEADWAQGCLRKLIEAGFASHASVIVAQYLVPHEVTGNVDNGYPINQKTALEEGAAVVQMGPTFAAAVAAGKQPFRDSCHPNVLGQRLMAQVLLPAIEKAVEGQTKEPKP